LFDETLSTSSYYEKFNNYYLLYSITEKLLQKWVLITCKRIFSLGPWFQLVEQPPKYDHDDHHHKPFFLSSQEKRSDGHGSFAVRPIAWHSQDERENQFHKNK